MHTRPPFLQRKRTKRAESRSRILQVYLLIVFPVYVTIALVFFRPRFSQSGSLDHLGLRQIKFPTQFVDRPYPTQNTPDLSIERVVVLGGEDALELDASTFRLFRLKEAVNEYIDEAKEPDQRITRLWHGDECKPIADWAQKMFPVCNVVHELNLFENGQILGKPGWFRQAWEVDDGNPLSPKLALKTLRLDRGFLPEYYELHRRDALSMERLTSSPYVMDIFAYCGQSTVNELAFGDHGLNTLYNLSMSLRDNNTPFVLDQKLRIGALAALALSHVHSVPAAVSNLNDRPVTIAHYDVNPRNYIINALGIPKINDFNVAEFITWNNDGPCGFESRLHEPWWRAPEEMVAQAEGPLARRITEAVDVYSLGNVLYVLLTGLEPRGKEKKKERYQIVSSIVASGARPTLPKFYALSDLAPVVALRKAIFRCYEPNPALRPTAMEIAQDLFAALNTQQKHLTRNRLESSH